MAYLYRHIRLDKNQPFYIGISLKEDDYKRAYSKNRTKFWAAIANKSGYEVEIVLDDLSPEQAKEKEVEFIQLYGRVSNGGTLCNLTDGGDGTIGYRHRQDTILKLQRPRTEEEKQKLSKSKKGKKLSEETKAKMSVAHTGRKQSEACKEKLRNRVFSEETRARMGAWQKGVKKNEESTRKRAEALKGKPSWNKGILMSEETKQKLKKPKSIEHIEALKKPKKRIICPNCLREGGSNNMYRYHFKNCKYEKVSE